jgi:hypothetical protein
MTEPSRRFPAPWHADPMPGGYVVRDANMPALAYLYSATTMLKRGRRRCSRRTRRDGSTARDDHRCAMAKLSDEQQRALKLLAGSPDGCTTSIMMAHGFTPELLAALVAS